ncbi:MAG: ABC transporter substrate-binding protein [Propionibacteriaceae bacterium]|jgi:peptide/nickel transport system substrate-binding protein|nr:ABC transporter substrate-binding protein [Propionibacteriaceae bacterium]
MIRAKNLARSWVRGAAVVLAAVVGTSLTACATDEPTVDATTATMTQLVVGATLEPNTLDFSTSSEAAIGQLLLYNVYETLVKVDDTGAIQPLLATSWEQSDDRLTYTFHLDPAAHFASGTPVDAEAVVASIERLKPAANSNVSGPLGLVDEAAAVDAQTLTVTLTRPSNSWLYDMTAMAGIVVDPAAGDLATQPAGSGPYQLSDWIQGDRIGLARDDAYWGQPGAFETVEFRYYSDPNTMSSAMLSGDIDIISDLTTPGSVDAFNDQSKFQVIEGTSTGEVTLGFNHDRPGLQDLRVRQAINYGIDRQALMDTVWGGKGLLIGSMVTPTDPYFEDLSQTYPYDPAKAQALLVEAGQTDLTLQLRTPVIPYATAAAQVVASQLGEIGITVTVEEIDFATWLTQVYQNGDYDLTIVNHAEPRDLVQFSDPDYYWHYNNPEFNELMAEADAAPADEYVPLMQQAARILADDAAADWLFLFPHLVVAKVGIDGIPANSASLSFDLSTITAG